MRAGRTCARLRQLPASGACHARLPRPAASALFRRRRAIDQPLDLDPARHRQPGRPGQYQSRPFRRSRAGAAHPRRCRQLRPPDRSNRRSAERAARPARPAGPDAGRAPCGGGLPRATARGAGGQAAAAGGDRVVRRRPDGAQAELQPSPASVARGCVYSVMICVPCWVNLGCVVNLTEYPTGWWSEWAEALRYASLPTSASAQPAMT